MDPANPALPAEPPLTAPPAPPPPAPPPEPATGELHVAWAAMAALLAFVLVYKLVPALVAGLAVFALIRRSTERLAGRKFAAHTREHLIVVVLLVLITVGVVTLVAVLLVGFLKGKVGNLPLLIDKMASAVDHLKDKLGSDVPLPNVDQLRESVVGGLREHARELRDVGAEVGHVLAHVLVGIVLAAMATFDQRRPDGPLLQACMGRMRRLQKAFEQIVFAQVKISGVNAILTGIFLLIVLPIFGVYLPLRKTLVIVTFVAGMIPIVGNLISNSVIVVIALGTSIPVSLAALGFLIGVHKLEYFVNAQIVGGQIHAAAWEMVAAILVMEATFGIEGVIVAPILYAYLKNELGERGLLR